MERVARHIDITGLVQGVGFRPFIYRHANSYNLYGWVRNHSGGVEVHIEGRPKACETFVATLRKQAPKAARIHTVEWMNTEIQASNDFRIAPSLNGRQRITNISPDIAVCPQCLDDMRKQPRRFKYPFTNCTHCGPRFSIVNDIPYDRQRTTMEVFEMCPGCRKEYESIDDRRFHAQPVSCWHCGPVLKLIGKKNILGNKPDYSFDRKVLDSWQLAVGNMQEEYLFANCQLPIANLEKPSNKINHLLNQVAQSISSGYILALKSIGGFQLIADAGNEETIQRLREIKQRHSKPFAVMFKDLETASAYTEISEEEAHALQSWRRPIVILKAKKTLSEEVRRGFSTLGAVLPYSPFHYLMMDALNLPAIVFTSANLKNRPLISENHQARQLLEKDCCDAVLQHDRAIHHKLDDSIVRIISGKVTLMRRARGYVPEPVQMRQDVEGILAMGADLKNSFCIGKDYRAIMSQHLGDLENYDAFSHYRENIEEFLRLFRMQPKVIACDAHPDYHSARYASALSAKKQDNNHKPPQLVIIQHHHAHIASVMAEHGLDEQVIGVAMDGTGYGDDGKIWGSEFFVNNLEHYERYLHLRNIPLPGGEKAIKEPWRIATVLLYQIYGRNFHQLPITFNSNIDRIVRRCVVKALDQNINIHESAGMGRLFDAVAALLNIVHKSHFDGEGPLKLENIIMESDGEYPISLQPPEFNYELLIKALVKDIVNSTHPGVISARFHNTVIKMIEKGVRHVALSSGLKKVVLSGGLFQNKYITEKAFRRLQEGGFEVYINEKVPCNDGGIALGQLAIASKKLALCV